MFLDIFHVNENCNSPCWSLLQNFVGNVFVFLIIDNIARVGFTTVICSVDTAFQIKYYLLCRRDLDFTDVVTTLRSMEFVADVMLFEDSIEELNIITFCSRETMTELLSPCFFPSSLLLC